MVAWADLLADPGSVRDVPRPHHAPPLDSVDGMVCTVGGRPCAVVWFDLDVAAGTLSRAAADRFVEVARHATEFGLPLLGIANSGGVRMQEGPRAFVRMAQLADAVRHHRDRGLPVVAYLADPTTGGVLASWGSLAHVTVAEPGALIGFTGPRIAAGLGMPIEPPEVQRAEGLAANGHLDAIVPRDGLAAWMGGVLRTLAPDDPRPVHPTPSVEVGPTGWDAVAATRRAGPSGILGGLLADLAADAPLVELAGDRQGHRDDAVWCGLGRLHGRRVLVIAHRSHDGRPARPTAAGLRTARRCMQVADELGSAVVTVIDTPGPVVDARQETEGFAGEVARSIDALGRCRVPTVALLAGQGGGGPAMAWFATRRRLAVPQSWLAPIAPEAGSLIVHRDTDHAADIAALQEVSAIELARDGVVDRVIDPAHVVAGLVEAIDEQRS